MSQDRRNRNYYRPSRGNQPRRDRRQEEKQPVAITEAVANLDDILNGDGEKLVCHAEKIANLLGNRLSATKIRKIYNQVRSLEKEYNPDVAYKLQMLRPKLAYSAVRDNAVTNLKNVLDPAIQKVDDTKKLLYFKDFFEAILAYHKRHDRR